MKFIVCFLHGCPRLVGFVCRDVTEVPFLSQYDKMIMIYDCQCDFDNCTKLTVTKQAHCKVCLLFLGLHALEISYYEQFASVRVYAFVPLRNDYLHKLFRILYGRHIPSN